jgi:hypothetical protein
MVIRAIVDGALVGVLESAWDRKRAHEDAQYCVAFDAILDKHLAPRGAYCVLV